MLDYLGIFSRLNENKVKYIVVGDIAVNLYGTPRATYDIDLLLEMSDGNLKKFLNLLKKWGFKPKVPISMVDFLRKENREKWIEEKNITTFTFYNDKWVISEIDVVIATPVSYERAIENIIYKKLEI